MCGGINPMSDAQTNAQGYLVGDQDGELYCPGSGEGCIIWHADTQQWDNQMTARQCFLMNDALNAASNWMMVYTWIPSVWNFPLAIAGNYEVNKWNQQLNHRYCGGPAPAWPY